MEQFASDEGSATDDCRAQSSGQLDEQWNRGKIHSASAGHGQEVAQLIRGKVDSDTWDSCCQDSKSAKTERRHMSVSEASCK